MHFTRESLRVPSTASAASAYSTRSEVHSVQWHLCVRQRQMNFSFQLNGILIPSGCNTKDEAARCPIAIAKCKWGKRKSCYHIISENDLPSISNNFWRLLSPPVHHSISTLFTCECVRASWVGGNDMLWITLLLSRPTQSESTSATVSPNSISLNGIVMFMLPIWKLKRKFFINKQFMEYVCEARVYSCTVPVSVTPLLIDGGRTGGQPVVDGATNQPNAAPALNANKMYSALLPFRYRIEAAIRSSEIYFPSISFVQFIESFTYTFFRFHFNVFFLFRAHLATNATVYENKSNTYFSRLDIGTLHRQCWVWRVHCRHERTPYTNPMKETFSFFFGCHYHSLANILLCRGHPFRLQCYTI